MKTATIYSTYAECYRDLHEVIQVIKNKHDIWVTPKVTPVVPEGVDVEFVIQGRLGIDAEDIKSCIRSVPDADDMLDNLKIEVYEYPEDWYMMPEYDANDHSLVPMTSDNLRKNYVRVS